MIDSTTTLESYDLTKNVDFCDYLNLTTKYLFSMVEIMKAGQNNFDDESSESNSDVIQNCLCIMTDMIVKLDQATDQWFASK